MRLHFFCSGVSMKQVIFLTLALFLTASCGKKAVKKKYIDYDSFSEASYVEDIEIFMPQLKALFNDQLITDHFTDDADLIFLTLNVNDDFLGKNFTVLKDASSCSYYYVRPYSPTLLSIKTKFNTCLNPASENTVNYPGNYTYELNPYLKEALELTPDRIAVREVTYEGQVYVGFGIQKDSGFGLSNNYKEYVVIPDFPLVLNPVLVYDSQSGETRALKGIQVR